MEDKLDYVPDEDEILKSFHKGVDIGIFCGTISGAIIMWLLSYLWTVITT